MDHTIVAGNVRQAERTLVVWKLLPNLKYRGDRSQEPDLESRWRGERGAGP